MSLLEVRDLSVRFGERTVVDRVSFTLDAGEKLALVGESASGKTVTALSTLRLIEDARLLPFPRLCPDKDADLLRCRDEGQPSGLAIPLSAPRCRPPPPLLRPFGHETGGGTEHRADGAMTANDVRLDNDSFVEGEPVVHALASSAIVPRVLALREP